VIPVRGCGVGVVGSCRTGLTAGRLSHASRYTTYYAATSNTSESFAAAVFSAFTATYASTGNSEPTLSVTSPETGQTYTMRCAHYGQTVHCNGGNNAIVGIY
jgi:hypothetical protein